MLLEMCIFMALPTLIHITAQSEQGDTLMVYGLGKLKYMVLDHLFVSLLSTLKLVNTCLLGPYYYQLAPLPGDSRPDPSVGLPKT